MKCHITMLYYLIIDIIYIPNNVYTIEFTVEVTCSVNDTISLCSYYYLQ